MHKQLDLFHDDQLKLFSVKSGGEQFIVCAKSKEEADLLVYMRQSDETYGNAPTEDYIIEQLPQNQQGILLEWGSDD